MEEIWRGVWPEEHEVTRRFLGGLVTLHQPDCLIAAAAVTAGATLATGNPAHFTQAEIDVAHWPVGA